MRKNLNFGEKDNIFSTFSQNESKDFSRKLRIFWEKLNFLHIFQENKEFWRKTKFLHIFPSAASNQNFSTHLVGPPPYQVGPPPYQVGPPYSCVWPSKVSREVAMATCQQHPYTGKNLEKILSFLQNLMIFSQNDNFVLKFVKI